MPVAEGFDVSAPDGVPDSAEKETLDAEDASPSVGLFRRLFSSRKSSAGSQGPEAVFDTLEPLPDEQARVMLTAADEAERRLLAKVDDQGAWTEFGGSLVGLAAGLRVWHRPSDVRSGGSAAKTSFMVNRPPREVAEVIERLNDAGSLDFGFKTRWSRTVGGEGNTTVRYLTLSKWMTSRDFHCVTRCGFVKPAPPPRPEDLPGIYTITHATDVRSGVFLGSKHVADIQPGAVVCVKEVVTDDVAHRVRARIMEPAGWISLMDTESGNRWVQKVARTKSFSGADERETSEPEELRRYVFASTSLGLELLASAGLPCPGDAQCGSVYISGALAAGTGDGSCRVEVMLDVDPSVTQLSTWVVDRDVRLQMLNGAVKLHRALTGVTESDGYPPVDEVAPAPPKMRLSETWGSPDSADKRKPDVAA